MPMGAKRDFKGDVAVAAAIAPAVIRTATVTGSAVDLGADGGHEGAVVYLNVGAVTDGTHTPKLQESDASGSGYADVAAGDLSGAFVAAVASTGQKVGYIGTKRYIRVVVTVTGSPATGAYYDAVAILGRPRTRPVA